MQNLLDTPIMEIAGVTISGRSVLLLAVALAVSFFLSWLLERMLRGALLGRETNPASINSICRSLRFTLLLLGLGVGIELLGINLRTGLVAVAYVVREYLDFHLFDLAGTNITLATILVFAIIVALTIIASRVFQGAAEKAFRLRGVSDEGTVGTARRLIHFSVLVIGLGIGLNTIGINLSALFAAGALFAVALGFAMQNITQNFISGVILLVERTIKPGDVLSVDGQVVKISDMRIRATVGRTLDDEEIIIPNSVLVQNKVTNRTMQDRYSRLRVEVGVVYSSDMKQVREVLQTVTDDLPWRLKSQKPRILMIRFGASSVDFEVSVWIDDPWTAQQRRSDLHEAIWWALKDAGITIAFPQMDVHFDPPISDSIASLVKLEEAPADADDTKQ